jgi:hypothetical protein
VKIAKIWNPTISSNDPGDVLHNIRQKRIRKYFKGRGSIFWHIKQRKGELKVELDNLE